MSHANIHDKGLTVSVQDYTSRQSHDDAVLVRAICYGMGAEESCTSVSAAFDISPEKAIQLAAHMDRIAREMIAARSPLATVAEAA